MYCASLCHPVPGCASLCQFGTVIPPLSLTLRARPGRPHFCASLCQSGTGCASLCQFSEEPRPALPLPPLSGQTADLCQSVPACASLAQSPSVTVPAAPFRTLPSSRCASLCQSGTTSSRGVAPGSIACPSNDSARPSNSIDQSARKGPSGVTVGAGDGGVPQSSKRITVYCKHSGEIASLSRSGALPLFPAVAASKGDKPFSPRRP